METPSTIYIKKIWNVGLQDHVLFVIISGLLLCIPYIFHALKKSHDNIKGKTHTTNPKALQFYPSLNFHGEIFSPLQPSLTKDSKPLNADAPDFNPKGSSFRQDALNPDSVTFTPLQVISYIGPPDPLSCDLNYLNDEFCDASSSEFVNESSLYIADPNDVMKTRYSCTSWSTLNPKAPVFKHSNF